MLMMLVLPGRRNRAVPAHSHTNAERTSLNHLEAGRLSVGTSGQDVPNTKAVLCVCGMNNRVGRSKTLKSGGGGGAPDWSANGA